jgi:hypothetical protein
VPILAAHGAYASDDSLVGDTNIARTVLHWKPLVDLDTGLRRCFDYVNRMASTAAGGVL